MSWQGEEDVVVLKEFEEVLKEQLEFARAVLQWESEPDLAERARDMERSLLDALARVQRARAQLVEEEFVGTVASYDGQSGYIFIEETGEVARLYDLCLKDSGFTGVSKGASVTFEAIRTQTQTGWLTSLILAVTPPDDSKR